MVASLQRPTTSSLGTTLTEASNQLKLSCFCWLTKSSLRRTSSSSEEITSVDKSTAFTGSTMSARIDFQSVCGRSSKMFSTACQLPPSSTTRSSVCTVAFPPSLSQFLNYNKSLDLLRSQRMVSCATCSGQTPRKDNQAGVKMIEVFHTRLGRLSSRVS